jgi:hypothetical protein
MGVCESSVPVAAAALALLGAGMAHADNCYCGRLSSRPNAQDYGRIPQRGVPLYYSRLIP